MSSQGFVNQAFRNMVNWHFYHDVPVRILFYHLLTIAKEDDKIENGICVKTGNVLTTIAKLEKETLLTSKQLRLALTKLSSSGEISVIPSRQNGTIINITKWLEYKCNNASNIDKGKQRANEGQTEVIDNQSDKVYVENQRANKGQTNPSVEPQKEQEGKQRANEGQTEHSDFQDITSDSKNQRANEGQTETSSLNPQKEDIPPIPPIEVKEQEKDTIKEKNTKKEKTTAYPFDMFWNLYDKKNDKQKCEALWAKLSEADRKACIEYLPAYVASTSGERKQYRRYPETFLRNRSWENELPVVYPQQQMLFPAQETPLQKALREADNY